MDVYNSTIQNSQMQKQPKCPSTDNGKQIEYMIIVLAIKTKEVLMHTTWMNLENAVLDETIQTQNVIYHMIVFT